MIPTLVSTLLHGIHLDLPIADLEAIPQAAIDSWEAGYIAPLEAAVAKALGDSVDLSAVPVVGAALEKEKAAVVAELVSQVAAVVATPGALDGHKHHELATLLIDSPEKARAVLALPGVAVWHPAFARVARAVVAG